MSAARLKVLVVDDSPLNRSELASSLVATGQADVVGNASNGAEALQQARVHKPDLITLDLEMPELDGFAFLRLIPSVWRCPVIVISGYSNNRNVFRALELGAVDFVAKPETSAERRTLLGQVLSEKLSMIRSLSPHTWQQRPSEAPVPTSGRLPAPVRQVGGRPNMLVGITASTGGPGALAQVLSNLKASPTYSVLIAQHMPDKFTTTLAERLDRQSKLMVSECTQQAAVLGGTALVCAGRRCMEVRRTASGYEADVSAPRAEDRYVPSADRLFTSIAASAGRLSVGVVLTGMGDDGLAGAKEIARQGGFIIAEGEETAVVYGMPRAVVEAGIAHRVLPLDQIAGFLNELLRV